MLRITLIILLVSHAYAGLLRKRQTTAEGAFCWKTTKRHAIQTESSISIRDDNTMDVHAIVLKEQRDCYGIPITRKERFDGSIEINLHHQQSCGYEVQKWISNLFLKSNRLTTYFHHFPKDTYTHEACNN